jgi:signal transduction histidine kinase
MFSDKREIIAFIVTFFLLLLSFIAGVLLFLRQAKKRRLLYTKETEMLNERHQNDLLTSQLHTQTQTMQFIGREIHDNVGQKLTLASLYSKQLLGNAKNAEEKINTISNIIDESLADLRQLSKSLTNPSFAEASLAQLLQEEAVKINSLGSCHVLITDDATGYVLTPAQKNILFRLLQEFIQNSLKHAGCKKIKIGLQPVNNNFTVSASDDGKGFDTTQKKEGQGLLNMQRRAEELNAVYEFKSAPGMGTQMILQLQLF